MNRSSNVRYLGYGFLIGSALAILGVITLVSIRSNAAASTLTTPEPTAESIQPLFPLFPALSVADIPPSPTFTPTPTYVVQNPMPTETPTPTNMPTFSPTPSMSEQKLSSGELAIVGPLAKEQQMRLYDMSLSFIALTTKESRKLGEQFAGAGYGSPTLICGPLSIAILQKSGLFKNKEIVPLDFWLLNPFLAKDRALANRAFPPEQYENRRVIVPLRNIDYAVYPLYPGDFLYIKHGSGGTFDHMLVVNRVDNMGRAYSVTNHDTEQGFIINEVMLYDPNDPAAGIFKQWTARRNSPNGATGFGGFELWRQRTSP